jgi:hypothetical protein
VVRAAVAIRRIAMARQDDFGFQFLGPDDGGVKIVDLEP